MSGLEFKEYNSDGSVVEDTGSEDSIRAAIVDNDETEVVTRDGSAIVNKGDVIVETDRPGVYDVISADNWNDTGYGGHKDSKETSVEYDQEDLDNADSESDNDSVDDTETTKEEVTHKPLYPAFGDTENDK
jgi:hypothetical protein